MTTPFDYSVTPVSEIFGSYCFDDEILKQALQSEVYQQFLQVKRDGDLKPERPRLLLR